MDHTSRTVGVMGGRGYEKTMKPCSGNETEAVSRFDGRTVEQRLTPPKSMKECLGRLSHLKDLNSKLSARQAEIGTELGQLHAKMKVEKLEIEGDLRQGEDSRREAESVSARSKARMKRREGSSGAMEQQDERDFDADLLRMTQMQAELSQSREEHRILTRKNEENVIVLGQLTAEFEEIKKELELCGTELKICRAFADGAQSQLDAWPCVIL